MTPSVNSCAHVICAAVLAVLIAILYKPAQPVPPALLVPRLSAVEAQALPVRQLVNLGKAAFKRYDMDEGGRLLEIAAERSQDAKVHFLKAYMYSQTGAVKSAKSSYEKALEMKPDYTDAMNNLAVLEKDSGQISRAVALYMNILALAPHRASAHFNLGNVRLETNHAMALGHFKSACSLDPRHRKAHRMHAFHSMRVGDVTPALRSYLAIRQLDPKDNEAGLEAVRCYLTLGKVEEALALSILVPSMDSWSYQAAMYAAMDQQNTSRARARAIYQEQMGKRCTDKNLKPCAQFISHLLNRGVCNRLDWQLDDKAELALLLRGATSAGVFGVAGREVYPKTWVMPDEAEDFLSSWAAAGSSERYMQKLTWGGRGAGAKLLNTTDEAKKLQNGHIVQQVPAVHCTDNTIGAHMTHYPSSLPLP
jgi:Tfp pilus assembly protein PilF